MEEDALFEESLRPFCDGLKEIRIKLGLTQEELGGVLGVRRPTIGSWESGSTTPDVKVLLKLRQYARHKNLSVDLSELLGERQADRGRTPLDYAIHLLQAMDKMGMRGVYPNRSEAMEAFSSWLEKEENYITIVSSSFVGVMRTASQNVSELLKTKVKKVKSFQILMTHPEVSKWREDQEGRASGSIEKEILETVENLVNKWGVDEENIKFYRGAPTVFLLLTSQRMLLNPYTYQTEAFKTVTFEVAPTPLNKDSIYNQYFEHHFRRPWESQNSIPYPAFRNSMGS
jgi:transcriptional regulator with XRE-family HTH domain